MASSRHRPKSHLRKLLGGFVVAVAEAFAPTSALADGAPKLDGGPRQRRVPIPGQGSWRLGIQGADPRRLE
ncbi:hypothetical protein [Corallococcus llansteffanensis]|uniref:Uncharacterized protein n=1 Tax=Corallococcus llansteffanensis TaxID=2316731 RepID=A0A3A8PYA4_9BACT|nr:hypothetical protein [Corallococcus llansteffanensis]RKH60001.1 hypothetical protein D7V93_13950 [Corallococcus llansteffanensis]